MKVRLFLSVAVFGAITSAATAQDTAGINSLMDLCIPISATGASVRSGLRDAGWLEMNKPDAAPALANLIASQMWHLESGSTPQQRFDLTKSYTDAFYASLGNATLGPVYTFGEQVAMVLADGENISCIWAGPEDSDLLARIETIGSFPAVDGTVTAAKNQTVEVGGANYSRNESYAYIASSDRAGPLPYAARLDRSPTL